MKNTFLNKKIREAFETNDEINISVLPPSEDVEASSADGAWLKSTSFSEMIISKAATSNELVNAVRMDVMEASYHSVPVQKNKGGKFVHISELEEYTKQHISYDSADMEANKYGLIIQVPLDALEDALIDLDGDIKAQLIDAYADTVEELLVKGDAKYGVNGLESFTEEDGSACIYGAADGFNPEDIEKIYKSLPRKYRKNAKWVMNDDTVLKLLNFKDENGNFVFPSMQGEHPMLLNKSVIVSNECADLGISAAKPIFFGDLKRALVFAPRKELTIKKMIVTLKDIVLFKATTRLDVKKALCEAMAYYEVA